MKLAATVFPQPCQQNDKVINTATNNNTYTYCHQAEATTKFPSISSMKVVN